jgi:alpha-acetolactate decarboxylase
MTPQPEVPEKGVQFNEPPAYRIGPITEAIKEAAATLESNEHGALVGVWNGHSANAVFIAKAGNHVKVLAWIGKDWDKGDLNYGAAVRVAF